MPRRNWIFRDRTHPFDNDIQWWINFREIQIYAGRNCDHNWIHWMGHCDQQSYRFLKLTPLLHVTLVTRKSSPVVVIFKTCVASWLGWVRTALFRDFLYFLPSVGSVSDVLDNPRTENRGEKVKINETFNAADNRRRAANKKRGQSASSSWGHLQCIVGEIMGFPDLKTKTKRLAI